MSDFLKKRANEAFIIIGVLFTFLPETIFENLNIFNRIKNNDIRITAVRILVYLIILIIISIICLIYLKARTKVTIKNRNYHIQIQYGDIFQLQNCRKVISFDECFTTDVGDEPYKIKPNSICGQYLTRNSSINISTLIQRNGISQAPTTSNYQSKVRYESGTIVPNNDFLLMAFAKLDNYGLGHMSRKEYLDCLSLMWEEIDKYYAQKDICIPILGSGITRTGDGVNLTQQELLDLIILSYKLSNNKIKLPNKLIIVCRKNDDFSLNNIGESL